MLAYAKRKTDKSHTNREAETPLHKTVISVKEFLHFMYDADLEDLHDSLLVGIVNVA